jgi:type VI secretion system protein ImpH
MNFFRLCELMELAMPDHPPLGSTDSPANEPVRFRASGRLGFPGREIDAVEVDGERPELPPVIWTTFLGLHGVDARMPAHFVDEIAQRRDGAEPLAAFLDLFHYRIVTQFYRVARKYRYPVGFRKDGQDHVSRCLFGLLGLGIGQPEVGRIVPTRKLLSMLGLACQRTRTAEGLAGVLQHALPDATITVEEFHPVWIPLDAFERMPLGENCVLGRGFYDRANTVRVVFTPSKRESVVGMVPGGKAYEEVMALLRFYLGHAAHARLEMRARRSLMPAPVLNSHEVRLGYTAQLKLSPAGDTPEAGNGLTRVQLGVWRGVHPGAPGR